MMNRKALAADLIQFEDFAQSSANLAVGSFVELPMTINGAVTGRFEVVSVTAAGWKNVYTARRVA